jgi:hypothetical protein
LKKCHNGEGVPKNWSQIASYFFKRVELQQRLIKDLESPFVGFRFPPDDALIEEARGESFKKFESTKKPGKKQSIGQLG